MARVEAEIEGEVLELQLRSAESALLGSPSDEQVQARVESARRELASFRLFEAKSNTDLNPHDHGMRLKLAQAYLDTGRGDSAIGHFREALAAPEQRVAALIGLGRAHRARREFEAAVAQFILAKADLPRMDDRKKVVGQAGPYYVTGQQLLVKSDSEIASLDDVKGTEVCSVTGSTSLANIEAEGATPRGFDTYSECVDQVLNGSVDAMTTDDILLAGFASQNEGLTLVGGERSAADGQVAHGGLLGAIHGRQSVVDERPEEAAAAGGGGLGPAEGVPVAMGHRPVSPGGSRGEFGA